MEALKVDGAQKIRISRFFLIYGFFLIAASGGRNDGFDLDRIKMDPPAYSSSIEVQ